MVTSRRRDLAEFGHQHFAVVRDRSDPDATHPIRKCALHQMAILDNIRPAGRRTPIILQNAELALAVTDEVNAVDMHVGIAWRIEALHLLSEVRIPKYEMFWND